MPDRPVPERPTPGRPVPDRPTPERPAERGRTRTGSARRRASLARSRQRISESDDLAAGDPSLDEPGATPGPAEPVAEPAQARGGRLWRAFFRPGRGQVVAAVMLCLVGTAGVMQIRINTSDDAYTNARREDLIQLLDGLGVESRRLESEISDLQRTRTSLQSGADTERVARDEAAKRVSALSILAGTAAAEGPGIRMRITDPQNKVDGNVLLDAVEEMRDAGAEVIEINDRVRVVGSTWFSTDGTTLVVDGKPVARPVSIEVIGDPHSLEEAARFRGGIVSEITGPKIGGEVQIDQESRVVVSSLHAPADSQYARPATPAPTPR